MHLLQISNSLIKLCTTSLETYATSQAIKDHDAFWTLLTEAVSSELHSPPAPPSSSSQALRTKDRHELIVMLSSCLELGTAFKEFVQQVKNTYLQQGHLHVPYPAGAAGAANIHRGSNASTRSSMNSRNSVSRGPTLRQTSESGNSSKTLSATPAVGGAMLNVDQITNELGDFNMRVANVLDIVTTLSQFGQLSLRGKLEGLPRVAGLWKLPVPVTVNDEQYSTGSALQGRSIATSKRETPDLLATTGAEDESKNKDGSESDITLVDTPGFLEQMITKQKTSSQHTDSYTPRPLSALKEESMVNSLNSASVVSGASGKGTL